MCKLLEALDCENEEVVLTGFMSRYNVSYKEAQEIFTETKKMLWLVSTSGESFLIDVPLLVIDEMWHTFILHTKQYYNYCLNKFKTFIHHEPFHSDQQEKPLERKARNKTAYLEALEKQYNMIYNHLGGDTLIKWYDGFATKYTPEYLRSIKRIK